MKETSVGHVVGRFHHEVDGYKLTIMYYINSRLKGKDGLYPLYFQVTFYRKTSRLRSDLPPKLFSPWEPFLESFFQPEIKKILRCFRDTKGVDSERLFRALSLHTGRKRKVYVGIKRRIGSSYRALIEGSIEAGSVEELERLFTEFKDCYWAEMKRIVSN